MNGEKLNKGNHQVMASALRNYFDVLIVHETELWNQVERRLTGLGTVNLARFEILDVVERTEGCRVQDIADELRVTVGSVSRLADRMESDDLLKRSPHPLDGRSSQIDLTDHGRKALASTELGVEQALQSLIGHMDENELAVLTAFLRRAQDLLSPSIHQNVDLTLKNNFQLNDSRKS